MSLDPLLLSRIQFGFAVSRWHDEKPASEVLLAWPDVENRRNLFAPHCLLRLGA
jgi:hypothetical protein